MLLVQSLSVLIQMCVIPYLIGGLFFMRDKTEEKSVIPEIAFQTVSGLMVTYTCYELLMLMFQQMGQGFRMQSYVYLVAEVLLALAGFVCMRKRGKREWKKLEKSHLKSRSALDPFLLAAVLLIVIQIGAILFMATPDKDDAFYSGLSSMSLAHDYLLEFDAYGGRMTNVISKRYMVSALPVYQATLSLFSGKLHHLFIIHNLFPMFYMPLAYALFYRIGKELLDKEGIPKAGGKFLFCFALLHMIGNYYVFSPENFLVTRIWQGKALFVVFGVPMIWMCGRRALFSKKDDESIGKRAGNWVLVACTLMACTFMGETGLFLGPFMLGCQCLAACMITGAWKKILPAILCCVPELILFIRFLV